MIEWSIFCLWIIHAFAAPWTKVEESFNVQAIHDIVFHGFDLEKYDHVDFPGVVPRTFCGPCLIGLIGKPVFYALKTLQVSKIWLLLTARLVLGLLVFLGLKSYYKSVRQQFGKVTGFWFLLISASQFHFNFYATRPLPNIFALCPVLFVLSHILTSEFRPAIWLATFSAFVYRSELVLLFAPLFLPAIWRRELPLFTAIKHGISAAVLSLAITIPLDSWFWGKWIWPEAQVWWYNVVENKSQNWGTEPFYWYFISAIPRSMGTCLILVPIGYFLEPRVRHLTFSGLTFVILYSFLPHKELRFIIYVIPIFNLAGASAVGRLLGNMGSSPSWLHRQVSRIFSFHVCSGILMVNVALSAIFLNAAKLNYPGGEAMKQLHSRLENRKNDSLRIHIDVFCAQTGISRFSQEYEAWEYNKTENFQENSLEIRSFDYLLIGSDLDLEKEIEKYTFAMEERQLSPTFKILFKTNGYKGLNLKNWKDALFNKKLPKFELIDKVAVLEKK